MAAWAIAALKARRLREQLREQLRERGAEDPPIVSPIEVPPPIVALERPPTRGSRTKIEPPSHQIESHRIVTIEDCDDGENCEDPEYHVFITIYQ